ncbi:M48 family metalloprotease [Fluviicola taffensis]|uniref:Peptidase M48 Ste24p n=1 Tax=Fluviicola taffensis (strain DSM 16823 / NCIMB 13979 / RW262) TaxID=755732 RepID=F2IF91_FLUTR|nr:M48 family metalloprotease [Fluviicola taffensis]AEA43565.1 peptidase M48 Ste24p [Fluviicola taffensis DSM 16823]
MKRIIVFSVFLIASATALVNCNGSKNLASKINLFPVDQDRQLGAQVAAEIDGNPKEYPLLDSASNKEIYQYLYKIRNTILNSGQVKYKSEFAWRLRIIHDDSTLNAFCTPGGYIYVYTGIMKYLDNEAQLAGVLGHEIAHADLRHSTRQMTQMYGVQTLLSIIAGNQQQLAQITAGLVGLKFSRNHESEADKASVTYLCPTVYQADGGAGFFEKIAAAGGSRQPQFLSTHPNPENRIEAFKNYKIEMACQGVNDFTSEYKRIIAKLP